MCASTNYLQKQHLIKQCTRTDTAEQTKISEHVQHLERLAFQNKMKRTDFSINMLSQLNIVLKKIKRSLPHTTYQNKFQDY